MGGFGWLNGDWKEEIERCMVSDGGNVTNTTGDGRSGVCLVAGLTDDWGEGDGQHMVDGWLDGDRDGRPVDGR